MRTLFALFVIAVLVLGFGLYRGWFRTDRDKIKEDGHAAIEAAREVGGGIGGGVEKGVDKLREGTQK